MAALSCLCYGWQNARGLDVDKSVWPPGDMSTALIAFDVQQSEPLGILNAALLGREQEVLVQRS